MIIEKYSLYAIIIGALACVICGAIKLPIAKLLRKNAAAAGIGEKVVSDKIRVICSGVTLAVSAGLTVAWYAVNYGAPNMLTADFFTDVIIAFTAAKLIYMTYEGAGACSIKKGLGRLIAVVKAKRAEGSSEGGDIAELASSFLIDELRLTREQIAILSEYARRNAEGKSDEN